ncbi:MAG TPA: glycosyltransferase [Gaiellaceae bacterium]|nr:glycosyltransferase [Gaiellaceae bacterium]
MGRLLYVTPVLPSLTGNGLAMRAGSVLRALARHHSVHLHVLPIYARWDDLLVPELASLCNGVTEGVAIETPTPFDVLHVFRLAALPFARRCAAADRHVDLDDIEPQTYRRLAELHRLNSDETGAQAMEAEAARYEPLLEEALASWDRVYVCSELDRARLGARTLRVLPNVVEPSMRAERGDGLFTFLFVGNLDYYPNGDAVRWFATGVLPALRALAPAPFRVLVAGNGAAPPELEHAGAVRDLRPCYAAADVVIVPLRAGGGTRIKILEAFAHGVPVVSTPIGAEGLEAMEGKQLLLAADAEAFAHRCAELMARPELRRSLAEQALHLVRGSYSLEAAIAAVAPGELRAR